MSPRLRPLLLLLLAPWGSAWAENGANPTLSGADSSRPLELLAQAKVPHTEKQEKSAPAQAPEAEDAEKKAAQVRKKLEEHPSPELKLSLQQLAEAWKKVASAWQKTTALEAEANHAESELLTLSEQLERAQALAEQLEARRSRAATRLQELGIEPRSLAGESVGQSHGVQPPAVDAQAEKETP